MCTRSGVHASVRYSDVACKARHGCSRRPCPTAPFPPMPPHLSLSLSLTASLPARQLSTDVTEPPSASSASVVLVPRPCTLFGARRGKESPYSHFFLLLLPLSSRCSLFDDARASSPTLCRACLRSCDCFTDRIVQLPLLTTAFLAPLPSRTHARLLVAADGGVGRVPWCRHLARGLLEKSTLMQAGSLSAPAFLRIATAGCCRLRARLCWNLHQPDLSPSLFSLRLSRTPLHAKRALNSQV